MILQAKIKIQFTFKSGNGFLVVKIEYFLLKSLIDGTSQQFYALS